MNPVDLEAFQNEFGGFWVGVKFYLETPSDSNSRFYTKLRFCEAVSKSKSDPIFITPDLLDCPGALLSLGWGDKDLEDKVIMDMAEKRCITEQRAEGLVKRAPRLKKGVKMVGFQTSYEPDVLINYALPETVMKFLFTLENFDDGSYKPEISPIATVCGGVAVKTYLTGQVCLSFGCPDSRKFGGFSSDRLVIGVSLPLAKKLNEHIKRSKGVDSG